MTCSGNSHLFFLLYFTTHLFCVTFPSLPVPVSTPLSATFSLSHHSSLSKSLPATCLLSQHSPVSHLFLFTFNSVHITSCHLSPLSTLTCVSPVSLYTHLCPYHFLSYVPSINTHLCLTCFSLHSPVSISLPVICPLSQHSPVSHLFLFTLICVHINFCYLSLLSPFTCLSLHLPVSISILPTAPPPPLTFVSPVPLYTHLYPYHFLSPVPSLNTHLSLTCPSLHSPVSISLPVTCPLSSSSP